MIEGSEEPKTTKAYPWSLIVGQVFTAIWIAGVGVFTWSRWGELSHCKPNEVGDFIAGAAAPLAFLWLVVAVFLQKVELGLQRTELMESREAQQKQAAETAALVEENRNSVKLAIQARQEQLKKEDEARLDRLIDALGRRIVVRSGDLLLDRGQGHYRIFGTPPRDGRREEIFRAANAELSGSLDIVKGSGVRLANKSVALEELTTILRTAEAVLNEADETQFEVLQAWIDMIELKRFRANLDALIKWSTERG